MELVGTARTPKSRWRLCNLLQPQLVLDHLCNCTANLATRPLHHATCPHHHDHRMCPVWPWLRLHRLIMEQRSLSTTGSVQHCWGDQPGTSQSTQKRRMPGGLEPHALGGGHVAVSSVTRRNELCHGAYDDAALKLNWSTRAACALANLARPPAQQKGESKAYQRCQNPASGCQARKAIVVGGPV